MLERLLASFACKPAMHYSTGASKLSDWRAIKNSPEPTLSVMQPPRHPLDPGHYRRSRQVTLRGPVHSEDEKRVIEEYARKYAGDGNVTNELTIKEDHDAHK
jgi:hypothetical protein